MAKADGFGGTYTAQRRRMVDEIALSMERLHRENDAVTFDRRVADAMRAVPRHEFVPESYRGEAYANHPLPIGAGQTISQPFIVGLMTSLMSLEPEHTVLEVGTGSGYQAAVLSRLVREVYSIEVVRVLGEEAARTLERLGYRNVRVRIGDGYLGWPEHAPYDAIIVTAAPERIPEALIAQLKPGGRLVVPVGTASQMLEVIEKARDGTLVRSGILPVRFVPFTRAYGDGEEE